MSCIDDETVEYSSWNELDCPGNADDSFEVTNKTIMRKKDFRTTSKVISYEKWSDKYKKSIDCNNPKGFSQRAHCQGRKK